MVSFSDWNTNLVFDRARCNWKRRQKAKWMKFQFFTCRRLLKPCETKTATIEKVIKIFIRYVLIVKRYRIGTRNSLTQLLNKRYINRFISSASAETVSFFFWLDGKTTLSPWNDFKIEAFIQRLVKKEIGFFSVHSSPQLIADCFETCLSNWKGHRVFVVTRHVLFGNLNVSTRTINRDNSLHFHSVKSNLKDISIFRR